MKVNLRQHLVIRLEYILRIDGHIVARTPEGRPQTILSGFAPDLPKGLEAALVGKKPGEYRLRLPPERAYGPYDPEKHLRVKASELPEPPRVGGGFAANGPGGQPVLYRVVAVEGQEVELDANLEWAGKTLEYTFTIHSVRPADPQEVAHGHVHGEGGVQH